jgi:PAS domain S-box-containing protein
MNKSLRYRLLAWLLSVVIVTFLAIASANLVYQNQTKKIYFLNEQINSLYIHFLEDSRIVANFPPADGQDKESNRRLYNQLPEHHKISNSIRQELETINSNKRFSNYSFRAEMVQLTLEINSYFEFIDNIIPEDKEIYFKPQDGLSKVLDFKIKEIKNLFVSLKVTTDQYQKAWIDHLNFFYFIFLGILVTICLIASLIVSRHFVLQLEKLACYISTISRNRFNPPMPIVNLKNASVEITRIYESFRYLLAQIHNSERQHRLLLKNAKENKKRYQELADMLPQSIFETDNMGNYTYVNKAWFNVFGYSMTELKRGITLKATLKNDSGTDVLQNDRLEDANFTAIRKDGSQFEVSVYSDHIIKEGEITGKRGIIIDISDKNKYIRELQHETDKAQTSDQLKSSFLANMSHEIRTPMNSILGFSNLLASEEVPDDQKREFVQFIQSSGELLLNLVDDIIDIAKIEAGELKITKKECNLNVLFNELFKTFNETKKKLNKSSIELKLSLDEENPVLLFKTDPFRLRQILTNLIGNALKFTDKGSIQIGYKVILQEKLEFFVKDTGVGLSREELDIIFERFKRTNFSEEKNIKGTGLGLTISKNLVGLLGGEMWVDSTPGKGTTFYFTLPYLKITKPLFHDSDDTPESNYNWKDKTFLIVEDDPNSMKFLAELLKKTNANLLEAYSGNQALEVCSNLIPDIIIMDIQLPQMDGFEATHRIREINPDIPIIAQTAFAMAGDREKITNSGFDDYISKPIDGKQLFPKINSLLKQHTRNTSFSLSDQKHRLHTKQEIHGRL